MSNETKQDVFNALMADMSHGSEQWRARYDAAFPDNLPVIPKVVDEHIRWCKGEGGVGNVSDAMDYTHGDVSAWLYDENNSDTFALAWLLGVWRVEETGEIVKLEVKE